ncbi:hypothetical protein KAI04_01490 [Candidatus Pacearchaeota archaeon]|nr:hypothetical protein [Candidatus Pacearchaeota archaeon]
MKINKSIKLGIFFLIGILLLTSFAMAYYRSQTNYVQYGPYDRNNFLGTGMYDDKMCQAGQDFILQISPLGCEPAMVRSDLLEEQNVPVFCPISATQMNPLIDVQAIKTMTITGKYPQEVATVGFHPVEGALNPYQNELSQPVILDNIGYAVIVLRKQENESAMPEYVEGNLTARIRYDIQNAFGVGQSSFYLPVLDENDWGEKYKQYSFWDGRGYLRAEGVYDNEATISIYSDKSRGGILGQGDNKMIYSTVTLQKGETSNELYIPGFDFCLATMRLRLDDLENPDTRARFNINGNPVEVKQGERFLENNCKVISLEKSGINSEVRLSCGEDREGFHTGAFSLRITPNILLKINDVERNVTVGDFLYEDEDRKVFLGYAGTTGNTGEENNLYVYLMAVRSEEKKGINPKLTLEEIKSVTAIAKRSDFNKGFEDPNIFQQISAVSGSYLNLQNRLLQWALENNGFRRVDFKEEDDKFGTNVELIGFSETYNTKLPEEIENEFNLAVDDYRTLINSYPDEKNEDRDETLGESALFNLINLANELNQKQTMAELCDEFKQKYPDSKKSLEACKNAMKMSSSTTSITNVLIDNHISQISFEGVYEPTEYEYSARIRVNYPTGDVSTYTLTKNDVIYLDASEDEYFMLEDLEEDSAKLKLNIRKSTTLGNLIEDKSEWISLNAPETFNSGYTLTLLEVKLKKVAKVSLIPNIDYAQTNASFNFRVNIDKRNIQLSPEKTQEKIDNLDEEIKKWSSISVGLEKFVKTMKGACIGTSAYLTVKNYLDNTGGKGIARGEIMNGDGGWYEQCDNLVSVGTYSTQEQCLIKESENIDRDVDTLYSFMDTQNTEIKTIQDKYGTSETLFSTNVIDTTKFVEEYSKKVRTNLDSLGNTFVDPKGNSETINLVNMKEVLSTQGFEENKYSVEQLRDIDLYTKVLSSDTVSSDIKKLAKENLYSTFLDVQINSQDEVKKFSILNELNKNNVLLNVGGGIYGESESVTGVYSGGITGTKGHGNIGANVPVELVIFSNIGYLAELEAVSSTDYIVKNLYNTNGNLITDEDTIEKITKRISGFQKYDDSTYANTYKNAEVSYYETEPYKGYPAIVPFDIDEGWYVSVSQDLPVFGGIATYSKSGRVESYYLCNVGRNGREENRRGDDICRSVISLQGDVSNQFPGISDKGKVSSLMRAASDAVMEAQNAYKAGARFVTINRKRIKVGNPAVDVPGIKCQDFMSPKDCNTLFNVCDPVICPSSRCDFGGNYPVKDVVQSGIIGSIALCLPNAQEGIYVPVCLTGVQAGLDGLLSIFSSYQDCLQTSLETGQTVGVCDEIQSVYLCEYFYRQALPIAKFGIPKLTEIIISGGKGGSRGGGEYLGVADAWQRAESSVNYFAQYYAQNSYQAFKARSVEEAGQEIACDNFISLKYPDGSGLLDAITTPDSPVQFYGRFNEIPFTTVTNPPQSQYKVSYHIYAGKDRGTYYRVYFKGDIGSSYYQDTMFQIDVATGYIPKGEYASETKDFTAPSGYRELCIMVNGQEECGFKEVTTNFAVNYIGDSYLTQQASQTDIKTESSCISGTSSLYSLLNPNIQAGAEDLLNPSIYNEGVIRICATRNPGEGTDNYAGLEGSRWVEVGYCGDNNLKCWLDTQSVEKAIDFENLEEEVLDVTTQNYQEILASEGGYKTGAAFDSEIEKIGNANSNIEKINLINELIDQVFFNNEKASLLFLRGDAYAEIAIALYDQYKLSQEEGELDLEDWMTDSSKLKEKDETIIQEPISLNEIGAFFTSNSFESSILEFKDWRALSMVPEDENLYLQFRNNQWYVSYDKSTPKSGEGWISVNSDDLKDLEFGKYDSILVNKLKSENYFSGIETLVDVSLLFDDETITFSEPIIKFFNFPLEFTEEIFKLSNVEEVKRIYFKYDSRWVWGYDKRNWNEVTDIFDKSRTSYRGDAYGSATKVSSVDEIPQEYILLINLLDGKSKKLGSAILFNYNRIIEILLDNPNLAEIGNLENEEQEEICEPVEVLESVKTLTNPQLKVLQAAIDLEGASSSEYADCFKAASFVYAKAGVGLSSCVYSDTLGRDYPEIGKTIDGSIFQVPNYPENCDFNNGKENFVESTKLSGLDKGYVISYIYGANKNPHNAIFIKWLDRDLGYAELFDWNGDGDTFRYYREYITDDQHPVYMYWKPYIV